MARSRFEENKGFYAALGRRVALARESRMTQDALARKIALTRTSIINIEKGRQQVLVHTLLDIARALGVPPTELLPLEGDLNIVLRDTSKKGRDWILRSALIPGDNK